MKELSIKEKAQRYDKSIEVARKIKNGEPINVPDGTPIPVAIFPELRESEDEEISEWIKDGLKFYADAIQDEQGLQKAIAWLEKQGEKKPIELSEVDELLFDELESYINYDKGFSEEQKEWRINRLKSLRFQQKPAWSVEDEIMIKVFDSIIRYIVEVLDKEALAKFGTNREELFSWLKYLKERIGNFDDGYKVGFSAAKYNQWKPSDEQIEALDFAVGCIVPAEFCVKRKVLKELLAEIKKLREE